MSLDTFKCYLFFHPMIMWVVLGLALYVIYLGVQVRRTRMAAGDLKKDLIKGQFANRHHKMGSILLAVMIMGAIGGITVTYINNGKILIGPHLFVGLGIVGLISSSTALVPFMRKYDWARNLHISLNLILLGLFGWQAVTGVEMVKKIVSDMMMHRAG